MDVIPALSLFSQLGTPLVFQPRPLLGRQLGPSHGEWKDILNLRFFLSTAHFSAMGQEERAQRPM